METTPCTPTHSKLTNIIPFASMGTTPFCFRRKHFDVKDTSLRSLVPARLLKSLCVYQVPPATVYMPDGYPILFNRLCNIRSSSAVVIVLNRSPILNFLLIPVKPLETEPMAFEYNFKERLRWPGTEVYRVNCCTFPQMTLGFKYQAGSSLFNTCRTYRLKTKTIFYFLHGCRCLEKMSESNSRY